MNKIRLLLDLDQKDFSFAFATKLAEDRRFTALTLRYQRKHTVEFTLKLRSLLELFSDSVDDLIVSGKLWEESCSLFPIFLPKLKKCTLKVKLAFDVGSRSFRDFIAPQANCDHHLETLKLIDTDGAVVNLFSGCKQLKSFDYGTQGLDKKQWTALQHDIIPMNDFLATQIHLEKLNFQRDGLNWADMKKRKSQGTLSRLHQHLGSTRGLESF